MRNVGRAMTELAALLAALALGHPGHDDDGPACVPPPEPEPHCPAGADRAIATVELAKALLAKGQAPLAVRLLAREADVRRDAALVALGDEAGARLARARAATLP